MLPVAGNSEVLSAQPLKCILSKAFYGGKDGFFTILRVKYREALAIRKRLQ